MTALVSYIWSFTTPRWGGCYLLLRNSFRKDLTATGTFAKLRLSQKEPISLEVLILRVSLRGSAQSVVIQATGSSGADRRLRLPFYVNC
jgi:hypothetical protein